MTSCRHDAWHNLHGALVEVRKNGTIIRKGLVEDVMPDSSALWIAADGLTGRVLIEAAEGHEVWVEPTELEGRRAYRMTLSALQPGKKWHAPPQGRGSWPPRNHVRTALPDKAS